MPCLDGTKWNRYLRLQDATLNLAQAFDAGACTGPVIIGGQPLAVAVSGWATGVAQLLTRFGLAPLLDILETQLINIGPGTGH